MAANRGRRLPDSTEGLCRTCSDSGCSTASAAGCTGVQVANSGFLVFNVEGAAPEKGSLKLDSALLPRLSLSLSANGAGATSKGCMVTMGLYRAVKLWDSSCAYVPLVMPTKPSSSRSWSFCRAAALCSSFSTASCKHEGIQE